MKITSYDIVQVEDTPKCYESVEKRAQEAGLTYINFQALDELEAVVESTSARFWVVDGRFPKTREGPTENNSSRAVELIRKHHPNARIALHSAGTFARSDATELGIECFDKGVYTAGGLVETIKTILEKS